MRRLFLAFPVCLGVVAFVACGGGDGETTPTTDAATDAPVATDGGPADTGADSDAGPVNPLAGACTVTKTGNADRIFEATLLLPDGTTPDGQLLIKADGTIACAAASCAADPLAAAATVVKCTNTVISPGMVNPHDHIGFANNTPKAHGTERYEQRHDWRKGKRGHTTITVSSGASANVVRFAELRHLMGGTTSIAGAGGQAGLLRNLDNGDAQLEGLGGKVANSDTFPLRDSGGTQIATGCTGYSATRQTTTATLAEDAYLPHVGEGIDNEAHNEFSCQETDPNDILQKQSGVIHGIAVKPSDVAFFRSDRSSLIWSPRSNVDLYGVTAPVTMYGNMGVPVAIGTDWVPSGSVNLQRELRCADSLNSKYYGGFYDDRALVEMATLNGAIAVRRERNIGRLAKGNVADVVFWNKSPKNPWRSVLDGGSEDVLAVLRGGKALYGDAAVLDLAPVGGSDCEPLDVCGVAKKVCAKKDTGTDLATIKAAGDAIYANSLFYCRSQVPANEPSCTPFRTTFANGITATDKDGDGIDDGADNCPSVFNPKLPQYGDAQGDSDNDGIGDACDKCPQVTGEGCAVPKFRDLDGDGIENGVDNCVDDANADQADDDGNGIGNACDANAVPPVVTTIKQVRDPAAANKPAVGTRVRIENVYVTGVKPVGPTNPPNLGFFIQSGNGPYEGMFVQTGAIPTVAVGNKVTIVGKYEEIFTMSHVTGATVTVVDAGTNLPIAPVAVNAADVTTNGASAEMYEGMLCSINGPISVSMLNADVAPQDFDEFQINNVLRVDDDLAVAAIDNTYPVGTTFPKMVGVCGISFSNRKIWPRSLADMGL
jgi:cytosine/adenosine deaminase-related metal-dependent hydrolase